MAKPLPTGALVLCCITCIGSFVAGGCKRDQPTETAAEASATVPMPADPVIVLDPGQEPRLPLRYRIAAGTTTTSTSTFRVATLAASEGLEVVAAGHGLRFDVVSGPATITPNGVRFEVDVVRSEAVFPPDFNESFADELQMSAAALADVGAEVEMNDRGVIVRGKFKESTQHAEIPMRLLRMIVNARTTATRVLLPEEPVGLGARWQTTRELQVFGFTVTQVDTYQLIDRAGDELMLNLVVEQVGLPQRVEFPEDGIEIAVESMSAKARGQIILDLDALESDAAASGSSIDKLTVTTAQGTEVVEVDEAFDLEIANTTRLMPNVPVEDTGRRRRKRRR